MKPAILLLVLVTLSNCELSTFAGTDERPKLPAQYAQVVLEVVGMT